MRRSVLCDSSDYDRLAKETRTITRVGSNDAAERARKRNKKAALKNCALFTKCISQTGSI